MMAHPELDAAADAPRAFTLGAYLRDNAVIIALGTLCVLGVFSMCSLLGVGRDGSITVAAFVLICLALMLAFDFARSVRFWQALEDAAASARDAHEMATLLPLAASLEAHATADAIDRISSLANAELTQAQADAERYREYVELWIHETKTPIAAARLILDRMSGPDADALARELERMDNQVDQALYYARSTAVQKDYAIRRLSLAKAAREACKRQVRYLIEKQAIPSVDIPEDMEVLADEPWLVFMLGQVIANAAQYGASSIRFTAREEAPDTPHGRTVLEVCDDGCGISEADMPRIFDRGFTGSNGRTSGTATGMGLYLISLMCERLGLGIAVASEEGTGTRVIFTFPHDRDRLI